MKLACLLAAALAAAPASPRWFSGCVSYRVETRNEAGEAVPNSLGGEHQLCVSGSCYKLLAAQGLLELYDGRAGRPQTFGADGRLVAQADTLRPTLRPVAATATVLGYACRAVQVATPGYQSTVFYAPALRVNPAGFARATVGMAVLLRATDGALPLRVVTVSLANGFSLSSEATAVRPRPLSAAEFTAPAPAR